MNRNPIALLTVVFISGMTSLGIELTASRLIGNYFGSALPVWAAIIGMVLVYLTIGYILGGRLADRNPNEPYLYRLTAWAGLLAGIIPFVSAPIMQYATVGLRDISANIFVGSLVGVILLLSVPMVLLGCVSPFAIRLQTKTVESSGNTAGAIYALSTVGSILGTFLPVLVLIPSVGTRNTFLIMSIALIAASVAGLVLTTGRRGWRYGLFLLIILGLAIFWPRSAVRAAEMGALVYETESAYNYIQVVELDNTRYLILNEGHAVHSVYNPDVLLTQGPWDFFMVAPYFNKGYAASNVKRVAIIGLAAGTVARQLTEVYGPITIDGVDIDPEIIKVGQKYFAMNEPNLITIPQDGRYFMRTTPHKYDIVGVDAYRQPYVPAQLTTHEFFQEVSDHLTDDGVLMLNAGRTATDFRLVDVLASTMKAVFPSVFLIENPHQVGWSLVNTMVVATKQPTHIADFVENAATMTHPILSEVAASAVAGGIREVTASTVVFTDDKAPVEQVVDQMIFGYALGGH